MQRVYWSVINLFIYLFGCFFSFYLFMYFLFIYLFISFFYLKIAANAPRWGLLKPTCTNAPR